MSFLILANGLDVIAKLLEKLIAIEAGIPINDLPEIIIPAPELVISEPLLPNRYKIFRVELDRTYTDEALGVGELLKGVGVPHASYMSIITVPFAFTFKLNSTDMDAIDATVGLEQEDFETTEIFITNAVAQVAGTVALLNVEYRVD